MADDQSLHSLDNPHFFQPLLPGFRTHLSIPVVFFSKHLKGRTDHIKTAKLRTDASDKTWLVKINGLRFADGWEGFAVAHDLRIGDIIIFRHEGEMAFHVTVFGPSCCDIQFTSRSSHNISDDSQDQTNSTGNSSGEKRKRVKKTPRTTKKNSSSDHSHFMAHVSPWSLRFDRLYVPISFSRSIGLDNMSGKEIVLLNEEGRSWSLNITYTKASMQTLVGPGWRRFCVENGMNQGHQYTFKLVRKSAPPVIRLYLAEPAPESSLHHSNYVGSVSSNSLRKDRVYLQRNFVIANGLDRGFSEITLKNERGGKWSLGLRYYFMAHVSPSSLSSDRLYVPISFSRSNGMDNMSGKDIVLLDEEGRSWNLNITTYTNSTMQTYVGPGWRRFCAENGMSQGHQYTFKLVRKSAPPVIRLSLGEPAPESALHHSYYVGSVSSNDLRKDRLYLKRQFITANGLDRGFSEITLKNERGGKWSLGLRYYESPDHTYLGPGWKTFCQVNGIKAGDSFMLKVVETGDKPVLLLCSSNRGKTPLECSEDSDNVDSLSSDTSSGDDRREESQESEDETPE